MSKEHIVHITNGKGSLELANGSYNATAEVTGYDVSTLQPTSITVDDDTNDYAFTVSATGTLKLTVTDTGDDSTGVPIIGAIFYRTDASGNTYGDPITTDDNGEATFEHLPYDGENNPTIYFKQTESDGEHTFQDTVYTKQMATESETMSIANAEAALRNFTLEDSNYSGLVIEDGTINLTSDQ